MPQLGETVVEGTITKWLKHEGDTIERDEPLFEISTDKVDTEVPSPLAGKVLQILVPEGETVAVGAQLALIETDGTGQVEAPAAEVPPVPEPLPEPAPVPTPPQPQPQPEPAPVPAPPAPQPQPEPAPVPAPPAARAPAPVAVAHPAVPAPDGGPQSQILSPLVRRLADENHIDLSQVRGTGTGGRITKKDVQAFIDSRGPAPQATGQAAPQLAPTPASQPAVAAGEEVVPLTRMRQAIARNMVASMQTSARAWNLTEVNMEAVVRTREAARDSFREREGMNLTYMPFVARAVIEALLAFPDVNAELREDQLIRKHYVNLGVAVALDEGLIVPVVRGADTMNVVGLARAINDVATRARTKHLVPDDVQGGTFTITNPGPFGSIISVPIINPPQCAILAFDAIEKRPVVIDDAIAIRHMVYLSMSWDHRIIDGATAAKFLQRVKQNLESWDFGPEVGLAAKEA